MAEQKIQIEVTGDARDFIKASKEVQSSLENMGQAAQKTAADLKSASAAGATAVSRDSSKLAAETKASAGAFGEVRAAALTYFGSLATSPMAAFAGGVILVKNAMDELIEAEKSAAGLMAAFSTEKTNVSLERTKNLIDDLASRSAFFDDDAITSGAVVLKNLGATQDQLEALLPVATNFAAIYGTSVTDAAQKLAYGITGSTRSLREFGILLKGDATAGERYAAILERNKKASGELGQMSTGVTAAVGRMNKAFGDAYQSLGDNFEPLIVGLITIVEKLAQTLGLIPTILKQVANIVVSWAGMLVGSFAVIGEGLVNAIMHPLQTIQRGFSAKNSTQFLEAWQKQMQETMAKDQERMNKQFQDLFTIDYSVPALTGKMPGVAGGLIPEVKPGEAPPAAAPERTLAEIARALAEMKTLYGLRPDEAMGKAIAEVLGKTLPEIGKSFTMVGGVPTLDQGRSARQVIDALKAANISPNPAIQELIGMLGELDFKIVSDSINKLIADPFSAIVDPMKRLEAQLANVVSAKTLATAAVQGAVTGEQRQQAEGLLQGATTREKELQIQLEQMRKTQNDQFISSLTNAFDSFITSLADTLGRAAAGGKGVTGGQLTRAVGGLGAGVLAGAAAVAPAGATVAAGGVTLPLAGLLMVGGMIVGGLAGFFGGMLDQGDESNQHLRELVQQGKDARADALRRMGYLTEDQFKFAGMIQPLYNQAEGKGGKLGAGMNAIISRFGTGSYNDPQARAQLETIAKGIATGSGDWVGMVNRNMGLGIELNKENRQVLENLFLTLFNLVDGWKTDEGKKAAEAAQDELKRLGSMPRNPVYVYDVTPKEERFSFAPREAFFRASATRQVGTNLQPAFQMG